MADMRLARRGYANRLGVDTFTLLWLAPTLLAAFPAIIIAGESRSLEYGLIAYAVGWVATFIVIDYFVPIGSRALGLQGERAVMDSLAKLPGEYAVMNNVRVTHETSRTGEREIDLVVVGPGAVHVVEVKANKGVIAPSNVKSREWPVYHENGQEHMMRNPVAQALGQKKVLERRLAERGLAVGVYPLVAFSNPDAQIVLEGQTPVPIVQSGESLRAIIRRQNKEAPSMDQSLVVRTMQAIDCTRP